jgi:hypothetical protein
LWLSTAANAKHSLFEIAPAYGSLKIEWSTANNPGGEFGL